MPSNWLSNLAVSIQVIIALALGITSRSRLSQTYLIVAEPHEYYVVGASAEEIDCTGGKPYIEDSFLEPTDSNDFKRLASALGLWLTSRAPESIATELRFYSMMAEFLVEKSRGMNRPDSYPLVLITASNRLRVDIVYREGSMSSRDDILAFGVGCALYLVHTGQRHPNSGADVEQPTSDASSRRFMGDR